jgi:hypothetical protein
MTTLTMRMNGDERVYGESMPPIHPLRDRHHALDIAHCHFISAACCRRRGQSRFPKAAAVCTALPGLSRRLAVSTSGKPYKWRSWFKASYR